MSPLDAGRELDALVAEKVMGISLTPPREAAMVKVAWSHIACTGPTFELRDGSSIKVPAGATLKQPEGTTDWNDRYMLYVAQQREAAWTAEFDAVRNEPKPYSTDIRAAWDVVRVFAEDALRRDVYPMLSWDKHGDYWTCQFGQNFIGYGATAPLAICRAALLVTGDPRALHLRAVPGTSEEAPQ